MIKKIVVLCFGLILVSTAPAQSTKTDETSNWYIGASLGAGYVHCRHCEKYSGHTEKDHFAHGIDGGYNINSSVTTELSLFWLPSLTSSENNETKTYHTNMVTIAIIGLLPVTNNFSFLGKLGLGMASLNEGSRTDHSQGTTGIYSALGGEYKINKHVSINTTVNFMQANNFSTRYYSVFGLIGVDYLF